MSAGQEYATYEVRINGRKKGRAWGDERLAKIEGEKVARKTGKHVEVVGVSPSGRFGAVVADFPGGV